MLSCTSCRVAIFRLGHNSAQSGNSSACRGLGFVPSAPEILLIGKCRRADCPGARSSIVVFAVIAALVRVDLPSIALLSVVQPAVFVRLGK